MKKYEMCLDSLDSLNINQKFKDAILQTLDRICSLNFSEIKEVYLFGSLSKKTETALSDIDLLVVTNEAITDRYRRSEITCLMDGINTFKFDIVVYSEEQLITGCSMFMQDINSSKLLLMKEVTIECVKFTNTLTRVPIIR